ncbi:hypothetical protein SERLADRAFT_414166 [Serpula lacrymans var. lacrymans S7.9]|uniref:RRM domain-containing protein n=1 Tax=Serpula lacrymans var. lacrymans (strain S7.9) TaxID=578457 RepID=F8NN51_SERL9|nr:uncharacterized protein SERLADRAFT_414166 [Serpula lacrymans var. lacrymans S7.9]EGO27972.1 hypothetical protein SERLADRAFT_414166 [Serpula lacrymans var. lacrymans S7.9]
MSRLDHHDYDCPPGLGYTRTIANSDRDHLSNYHHSVSSTSQNNASGQQDRRMSYGMGFSSFSPAHSALPRSIGIQEKEYGGLPDGWPAATNRHTPANSGPQIQHFSSSNHHRPSPPPPHNGTTVNVANPPYYNPSDVERENYFFRQVLQPPTSNQFSASTAHTPPVNTNSNALRSTLWWGDLEPWMDEEYAKQVCGLMGWDPVNIKVPSPGPDPASGQQANNPGYCFLTFPSPSLAQSVLAQVANNGSGQPVTMPNSSKPFVLNWASSVPNTPMSSSFPAANVVMSSAQQQYPREYSIFVGDLAPETSNSDLVAVFRNPVLGLRNDREPKFIRPFLSCKSAKIMLDPVTGVSRGYGFVRFTEEADQQRALIEMHGLYCLSRPMRISPATAKFKPPPSAPTLDLPQYQYSGSHAPEQLPNPVTIALPLPNGTQAKSVSAPIAAASTSGSSSSGSNTTPVASGSASSLAGSGSIPSLSSGSSGSISSNTLASTSSDEMLNIPPSVLAQAAQQYSSTNAAIKVGGVTTNPAGATFAPDGQDQNGAPRYMISEESWKHHAQARAILGNLIGPNGEQLTSTDPYNTTVFVGGLSPLISEETLRTFFAPFGDIHYVKVPVGKHCGFVQFVRKADAERAIEKMQGFPIGGSRIRLSWGRSQYKAAQAAAQAAQAAAVQAQFQAQIAATPLSQMTPDQALQLLQKLGLSGAPPQHPNETNNGGYSDLNISNVVSDEKLRSLFMTSQQTDSASAQLYDVYSSAFGGRPSSNGNTSEQHPQSRTQALSSFSPFSPDPNLYATEDRRNSESYLRSDLLSKNFASAYGSLVAQGIDMKAQNVIGNDKTVGSSSGSQRYGAFLDNSVRSFEASRAARQEPISRPNSSQTSSQGRSSHYDSQEEHDSIHDLNGTLASLDLDQHGPWKSSKEGADNGAGKMTATRSSS